MQEKTDCILCGASPIENSEIDKALQKIFSESEQKNVRVFYCPGGFNYEKMSAASKLMMKMFIKAFEAKKDPVKYFSQIHIE